jgi:hypothetical protein
MAELGSDLAGGDLTSLRHVRASVDKRAAEEIASRKPCGDFDTFRPLFERVRHELEAGERRTVPVQDADAVKAAAIRKGDFFIVGGQLAYVADMGPEFTTKYERKDRRLRVIYDNGTENDVLQRSLSAPCTATLPPASSRAAESARCSPTTQPRRTWPVG